MFCGNVLSNCFSCDVMCGLNRLLNYLCFIILLCCIYINKLLNRFFAHAFCSQITDGLFKK